MNFKESLEEECPISGKRPTTATPLGEEDTVLRTAQEFTLAFASLKQVGKYGHLEVDHLMDLPFFWDFFFRICRFSRNFPIKSYLNNFTGKICIGHFEDCSTTFFFFFVIFQSAVITSIYQCSRPLQGRLTRDVWWSVVYHLATLHRLHYNFVLYCYFLLWFLICFPLCHQVMTKEVARGVFGFATWWSCFAWFASSSLGLIYQSYFSHS